jgi:RsiW-degrading membrane proteinase PrsW (M82 family)
MTETPIVPQGTKKPIPKWMNPPVEHHFYDSTWSRRGLIAFKVFVIIVIIFVIVLALVMATPEQRAYGTAVLVATGVIGGFMFYTAKAFSAAPAAPAGTAPNLSNASAYLPFNY